MIPAVDHIPADGSITTLNPGSVEEQQSPGRNPGHSPFLLAIITLPVFFPGEAKLLEGLLEAGLEKLHLRKPGAGQKEMEGLLKSLPPRWHSRLVLHGSRSLWWLADRYGIPQIHCPVKELTPGAGSTLTPGNSLAGLASASSLTPGTGLPSAISAPPASSAPSASSALPGNGLPPARLNPENLSTSLHSWEEMNTIETDGLRYVFISPVFDSISKAGYDANPQLLRRPAGPCPYRAVGLGGVDKDRVGELVRQGWDGAAVLGWIWKEPATAVRRYEQLQKSIHETNR